MSCVSRTRTVDVFFEKNENLYSRETLFFFVDVVIDILIESSNQSSGLVNISFPSKPISVNG